MVDFSFFSHPLSKYDKIYAIFPQKNPDKFAAPFFSHQEVKFHQKNH